MAEQRIRPEFDPEFDTEDHVDGTGTFAPTLPPGSFERAPEPAQLNPEHENLALLAMELGPTNEFTERRRARLAEDHEELEAVVAQLDSQMMHLSQRREDALVCLNGIRADIRTLDKGSTL